ncbi:MAG TPA: MASE1 domain-containing protein, partial [Gemmatimonadaceae bacterium]
MPPRPVDAGYAMVAVALAYYIGAVLGLALTPATQPVSTLWPPNAILLGALLLAPTRIWLPLIAATFPAHVFVEVQGGVPLPMVLCWFVSNSLEALLGAFLVRWYSRDSARLGTFRGVGVFLFFAALFAPFASSFLDAAFVKLNGFGSSSYGQVWRDRFFSNVLSILTLVPPIVTWGRTGRGPFRVGGARLLEATALATGLLVVCTAVFTRPSMFVDEGAAMLYAPLPFLLWAAVRFGPAGASASLLIFAVLSVWGEIHGHGPFVSDTPATRALPLQIFLIVTCVPLLVLAALVRERERAEEEARRSRDQMNLAMSAGHVTSWDWAVVDDPLDCDEFFGIIHVDDRPTVRAALAHAVETRSPYDAEYRVVQATGEIRWVLSKGRVLYGSSGRPERMIGVTADVTQRRRADESVRTETSLRQRAAQLRELADAMPQVVWTAEPNGHVDFFNAGWYKLTGDDPGEITDETWLSAMHSEDRETCLESWVTDVRAGCPHEHEGRFWSASTQSFRWHLVRALPVHDASGAIRRWYGTATDIDDHKRAEQALRSSEAGFRALGEDLERRVSERMTELSQANTTLRAEIDTRVRTEQALRASEERFAKAFRSSPDAICLASREENRIVEVNERWETLFGYSRDEAVGRSFEDLGIWPPEATAKIAEASDAAGCVRDLEVEVRNRTAEALRIIIASDTVDVGGEACLITMIRDVTERSRADQLIADQRRQLAHLGRVAVLGELSGALAHELNQPLTAIL